MRVDRQVQSPATSAEAGIADVVVRERGVVVPDEQAVLVGEVLDPILQRRVVQEAEVVRPRPQSVVVTTVLPLAIWALYQALAASRTNSQVRAHMIPPQ
jgi:hypothetical protein